MIVHAHAYSMDTLVRAHARTSTSADAANLGCTSRPHSVLGQVHQSVSQSVNQPVSHSVSE